MNDENCIRCGLSEAHQRHNVSNPPPEGWHPFRGQAYIDALEDALLFAREKNQPHKWKATGIIIDTWPSFAEKFCEVCGTINWGGKESGVCFGNREAADAIAASNNRRAARAPIPEGWGRAAFPDN